MNGDETMLPTNLKLIYTQRIAFVSCFEKQLKRKEIKIGTTFLMRGTLEGLNTLEEIVDKEY